MNNIIKQYRKIDEPAFQIGQNTKMISGPRNNNYYIWIVGLLKGTIETRQDLISQDIWPETEVADNEKITTMPMHQKNSWANNKHRPARTSALGAGASPQARVIPNSSTAPSTITDNRSMISYDITKTNHIFTTNHKDAPKPTEYVWIGISHTYLPTSWWPKCNKWGSHPESLNEDLMSFIKMMAERNAKKEQQYGPYNVGN
jgi:hypothetical protein